MDNFNRSVELVKLYPMSLVAIILMFALLVSVCRGKYWKRKFNDEYDVSRRHSQLNQELDLCFVKLRHLKEDLVERDVDEPIKKSIDDLEKEFITGYAFVVRNIREEGSYRISGILEIVDRDIRFLKEMSTKFEAISKQIHGLDNPRI